MADSEDEYDRKRRDKFRGERSSGDSYRSDRRDDRRPVVGGAVGGRDEWSDRNPFRGGGRARPDYRDYRPPRDRYGSPGREMPPAKRMRPDWGDDLRAGHRYSAYDPYLMHAWNEHYASTHGLHGGAYSHAPIMSHMREQNINSDIQTQPAMLTLKQFLDTQDDGISDSEVLRKYSEYKIEFKRQQLNEFFVAHKDEEWFKNKYHPVDSVTRMEEQLGFLKKRVEVFNGLLENGSIKSVSVDTNQQEQLLRLLDTVVIKLEGGTDDDLKVLDEKPRDIIYPDRVIEKKPEHYDDDVIITSVEKKKVDEPEGEPTIVSPRQIRRGAAASDDEENWDEDDDDDDTPKKKDDDEIDDEENDKFKDDDGVHHQEKKIERKRKPSNSDSSSSSSSSDSDTTSSSSSDEDEDADKSSDKYDLAKVKQEKEDEYEKQKTTAEAEKTAMMAEPFKGKNETAIGKNGTNGLDKKSDENVSDNTDENRAPNEIQITDKVDAEKAEEGEEIKKQGTAEVDDTDGLNTSAVSEEKSTDENLTNEAQGKDNENVPTIPSKENCDVVAETEPIDVDQEKDTPKPRALHRTSSIFLRNLAPAVTKAEIEAICQRFEGFLRVAIADPLVERRWYRRGWVTFKRDVNIKEYCWNLNNTRLRDCEMGAIVNRDLSRRVRPVNGMTAHKTVVRADIKLCAKIILNLDGKFKLWENTGRNTESTNIENKESENASNNYGFHSNNPVLQNITDYLIEEASAEEEELLGISGSDSKDTEGGESLERDPQLISVLDGLILYLRIVHSVDFYNHCEYPYEDEMPNRCGIIHARGPPPQKIVPNDVQEYIKTFEGKMQTFLAQATEVDDEELKNLGGKDPDVEVEKFVQANTQELAKDKWLCPLSGKKFKGPEFIRKHIFNKHVDKVEEVRKEVDYFNNYLRDAKRPQLPEHPGATKRTASESAGGYRPPPYAPMYSPYAAYAPPMLMPPRGGRGYGGRRDSPMEQQRRIIGYHDLDAPPNFDMFD